MMVRRPLRAGCFHDGLDPLLDERRNDLNAVLTTIVGRLHVHEERVDLLVVAVWLGQDAECCDLFDCPLDEIAGGGRMESGHHRDIVIVIIVGRLDVLLDVDIRHCSFSSNSSCRSSRTIGPRWPFPNAYYINK